jgi:hypothetical protein
MGFVRLWAGDPGHLPLAGDAPPACAGRLLSGDCKHLFCNTNWREDMKSKSVTGFASLLLCGLFGATAAGSALAQTSSGAEGLLNDTWVFNLGAFVQETTTKARLDGSSPNNPEIDFDESIGKADNSTRGRLDVLWRITPAHHLRFLYFDNSTTRSKTLAEDVKWGDYTFLAGSNLQLEQDYKIYELAYEWAFMRSPTYELAASFGVHYFDINLKLSGTATVTDSSGNTSTSGSRSRESDLPAPLPMIGIRGGWVVAPNWYLDAQAQWLKVNIDGYDGNWSDVRVGATWMFHRNFGVGLCYNWFGTNVDVSKDTYNGKLKLGYSGLQAYLTGTF